MSAAESPAARLNTPEAKAKAAATRARKRAERLAAEPEQAAPDTSSDRPPRAAGASSTTTPRKPANPRTAASITRIRAGLVMTFTMAGMGVSVYDGWDGQVIALNAERLADAWCELAEQNPRVRKALERMLEGSAWGGAIGTTAAVAVPIAVRHGMLPPSLLQSVEGMGVELPRLQRVAPAPAADAATPGPGPVDSEPTHTSAGPSSHPLGATPGEPVPPQSEPFGGFPANGAPS